VIGDEHISFTTSKIGSLVDVNQSRDPDGLRCFYYLVQVLHYFLQLKILRSLTETDCVVGSEVLGVLPHRAPFQDQAHLSERIVCSSSKMAAPLNMLGMKKTHSSIFAVLC